jgi:hypothetical protein
VRPVTGSAVSCVTIGFAIAHIDKRLARRQHK